MANDFDEEESSLAVIGMSGRFPEARNLSEYWQNLKAGRECISFFSPEELIRAGIAAAKVADPNYVRARGVLERPDFFDAQFFAYTPREAERIDPQQRLLLECAWEAFEHGGYAPSRVAKNAGVFVSASNSSYLPFGAEAETGDDLSLALSNDKDFLATRISYKLGLKGPSLVVQTACSSSLVAVHCACTSLLTGESDFALAGAVSVGFPHTRGYLYQEEGILSPDGHCRAFDVRASGTVPGSGVGVVLLKRLSDALRDGDTIHAIIVGSAINNDGNAKQSFAAPSPQGQQRAIADAMDVARVHPEQISYVEAHGTATPLGDAVEFAALNAAFRSRGAAKKSYCALASVKTNIGHLDSAAGIAGFIKAVLSLKHGWIPPSLHFERGSSECDFGSSPFFVPTKALRWDAPLRYTGLSSFGLGGTNAHVILRNAPQPTKVQRKEGGLRLLPLSAKSMVALESATTALAEYLKDDKGATLDEALQTLEEGREAFAFRRVAIVNEGQDAARILASRDPGALLSGRSNAADLALMFPGMGEAYVGMGQGLYRREAVFRRAIDEYAELLQPWIGVDYRKLLYPAQEQPSRSGATSKPDLRKMLARKSEADAASNPLEQTRLAHPIIVAFELALYRWWEARGVRAKALLGYSLGEYAAACVAGVFSPEDALRLVVSRATMIEEIAAPGAMLGVALGESALRTELPEGVALAAVTGPNLCVVSGNADALQAFEQSLAHRGIHSRRVRTGHALHSPSMEPVAQAFASFLAQVSMHAPRIPIASNVTGTWLRPEEAQNPQYWARHLTHTVQLESCIRTLWQPASRMLLEVGPGRTLSQLALAIAPTHERAGTALASLPSEYEGESDELLTTKTLAKLWLSGVDLRLNDSSLRSVRRVPLPTYPFERSRFFVKASSAPSTPALSRSGSSRAEDVQVSPLLRAAEGEPARRMRPRPSALASDFVRPRNEIESELQSQWEKAFGIEGIGVRDDFFELGGHSLLALQLLHRIHERLAVALSIRALLANHTIEKLAQLIESRRSGGEGASTSTLRERLNGADPALRRLLLLDYARSLLPEGEASSGSEVPEGAVADVILAVKRDFGFPLYPHEVLRAFHPDALCALLEEELERDPLAGGDVRELERRLAATMRESERSPSPRSRRASNPSAAFVLSTGRSGSTLLRVMLAGHPALFCPPELHMLQYATFGQRQRELPSIHFAKGFQRAWMELNGGDALDAESMAAKLVSADAPMQEAFRLLQERCHPRLLLDKSPSYTNDVATLERAESIFESPKYIYLVRHPYAVIDSYVRNRFEKLWQGEGLGPLDLAEFEWTTTNYNVLCFLRHIPAERRCLIRFEDLVRNPEGSMRQISAFLGIEYVEELLTPYEGSRMIDGVGDPNLHERNAIDPNLADAWERVRLPRPLCRATQKIAKELGYSSVEV